MRGYHHAGQPRLPKNNPISKQRLIIRKDYYFVRVLHRQLLYPSSTLGWVVLYLPDRQYNNLLRFAIAVPKKFQVQTLRVEDPELAPLLASESYGEYLEADSERISHQAAGNKLRRIKKYAFCRGLCYARMRE